MIYLRHVIFILLLLGMLPSVLSMDHASYNQTTVCASLPQEVWKQVFVWVNYSLENRRLSDTYPGKDVPYTFEAIRNIILYTRVCKVMYGASTPLITSYIQLADDHLKGEDKHSSLRWAIKAHCYPEHKAIPLYRRLGADINHIHNDGETALTYAILHDDGGVVHCCIKFKADLMQPNRRGQIPIDLAYEINSYWCSKLKDAGGDPENKYEYYGRNELRRIDYKGYKNYQPKKKLIVDVPSNSIMPKQPTQVGQQNKVSQGAHATDAYIAMSGIQQNMYAQGFYRGLATGILVCCIGYWIYSQCLDVDDDQKENAQDAESKPTLVRT